MVYQIAKRHFDIVWLRGNPLTRLAARLIRRNAFRIDKMNPWRPGRLPKHAHKTFAVTPGTNAKLPILPLPRLPLIDQKKATPEPIGQRDSAPARGVTGRSPFQLDPRQIHIPP